MACPKDMLGIMAKPSTRMMMTLQAMTVSPMLLVRDWTTSMATDRMAWVFYNILSGILRGLGDSVSALAFLLLSTVLNIGLDVWFVAGFDMKVAGVAPAL